MTTKVSHLQYAEEVPDFSDISCEALHSAYSPTMVWFSVSAVAEKEMCDKLVLYQRENMENDMLTLKDIKSCRLRVIRTATGMLQSELADKAGVSIRTLQSYEEGTRSVNKMSLETAYRLAKALNVPMEELVEVDEIQWKKQTVQKI